MSVVFISRSSHTRISALKSTLKAAEDSKVELQGKIGPMTSDSAAARKQHEVGSLGMTKRVGGSS